MMRRLVVEYTTDKFDFGKLEGVVKIEFGAYIYKGTLYKTIVLFTAKHQNTDITYAEVIELDLPRPDIWFWNQVNNMRKQVES